MSVYETRSEKDNLAEQAEGRVIWAYADNAVSEEILSERKPVKGIIVHDTLMGYCFVPCTATPGCYDYDNAVYLYARNYADTEEEARKAYNRIINTRVNWHHVMMERLEKMRIKPHYFSIDGPAYGIKDRDGHVECRRMHDTEEICRCEVSVDMVEGILNISSWFTDPEYMNRGYGRQTLKKALEYCQHEYGLPGTITYTWNGKNIYVLDWMVKHFGAVCTCPIAVQKTQPDDDWDSHIYELDRAKVLEYFGLQDADGPDSGQGGN